MYIYIFKKKKKKKKIKNRKAAGLDEIPRKYGRPDNSTTYCSDTATQYTIKIR